MHRNSQKRIYERGTTVFVTSVTQGRIRYFENDILAELFVRDLWIAKELKEIELFGYTVLPDHVHLLFLPVGEANYSEVMRSLKTNFSRDANDILLNRLNNKRIPAGDVAPHRLQMAQTPRRLQMVRRHIQLFLPELRRRLEDSPLHQGNIRRFVWQKSFRDHIIRDNRDFDNHLEYICNNAVRHGLTDEPGKWRHMWVLGMEEPKEHAAILNSTMT